MNFIDVIEQTLFFEEAGKSLLLLDIDDTLLKAQGIKIYRKLPTDKKEVALTPDEYAKDPASKNKENKKYYDYREFRDADKVASSIKTGLPIIPNLKEMDRYIQQGWRIGILTARGMEDVIANTMKEWLKFKNKKGELVPADLPRKLIYAINDDSKKHYVGESDFDKKANVIKRLTKEYDRIIFIDDDMKNVKAVKKMLKDNGIKNVMVKLATAKPA